jgi:adenylate kinase
LCFRHQGEEGNFENRMVGSRQKPNILITGTPGTGKTSTSSLLADVTQLRHINVGELVKEKHLHDGWDSEYQCHILNEDLVCFKLTF